MPLDRETIDLLHRYEKEQNRKTGFKVVKLPCCNKSVQIDRPQDQMIRCEDCKKTFILTWSKIGNHKIQGG